MILKKELLKVYPIDMYHGCGTYINIAVYPLYPFKIHGCTGLVMLIVNTGSF